MCAVCATKRRQFFATINDRARSSIKEYPVNIGGKRGFGKLSRRYNVQVVFNHSTFEQEMLEVDGGAGRKLIAGPRHSPARVPVKGKPRKEYTCLDSSLGFR